MDPEEILRAQRRWDQMAARYGERRTLAAWGPRPVLPTEGRDTGFFRSLLGGAADTAEGLGRGVAESAVGTVSGVAGLADAASGLFGGGGEGLDARIAESASGLRDRIAEGSPQTAGGRTGRFVGRLGGELAQALVPGLAATKVAKAAGAGAKLAPWLGLGTDIAADAAIEAGQRPEDSMAAFLGMEHSADSALGRALVGATGATVVGVPFEGFRAARKARAARAATREAELAADAAAAGLGEASPRDALFSRRYVQDATASDSETLYRGVGPDPDEVRPRQFAREQARAGVDPKTASPKDPDFGFRPVEELADEIDASMKKMQTLDSQIALSSSFATRSKRRAMEAQRTALEVDVRSKIYDYLGGVSEAGKNLAFHRWRVHDVNTMTTLHEVVRRALGDGLTERQMKELEQFVTFSGDQIDKLDSAGIAQWISKQRDPRTWSDPQMWTDLIRSGMLSALYSPLRAVVGNTGSTVAAGVGAPFRALSDAAIRYFAGHASGLGKDAFDRTYEIGSIARQIGAGASGFREGLGKFGEIVKRGFTETDLFGGQQSLEKLDLFKYGRGIESGFEIGDTDVVEVWNNLWFHLQGAMDTPYRTAVAKASVAEQAARIAKQFERLNPENLSAALKRQGIPEAQANKLASEALSDRIKVLTESPTPTMMARAMEEAQYVAFQQDTSLNDLLVHMRQWAHKNTDVDAPLLNRLRAGAFDLTFPFARTPSAIASRVVGASPVGLLGNVADVFEIFGTAKKIATGTDVDLDLAMEAIRTAQARLGRRVSDQAASASLVLGLGYMFGREGFLDGYISGGFPTDAQERAQFMREGKVPYGIKLGDRWWSLAQIPPMGHMLAVGASWAEWEKAKTEAIQQGVPPEELPGAADLMIDLGASAIDVVSESPFFQGFQRWSGVLEEGDKGRAIRRTAGQYAGSLVPNLVASVARSEDPIRLRRQATMGDAMTDAVVERLPWLNENLPARVDRVTGDVLRREDSGLARALSLIDPFGSSPARDVGDPVISELGEVPSPPSDPRKLPEETEREYNARLAVESPQVRVALESVVAGDGREAARLGVDPRLILEYQRISEHPDRPEVRQARSDLLRDIVTQVRRRQTEERSRLPEGETVGEVRPVGDDEESLAKEVALLAGGFTPGVGEAIDAYDLQAGLREGDYVRAGLAGVGLALPVGGGFARFYDRLKGAVRGAGQDVMPAAQWANWLTNSNKRDVSQNQVEYSGIADWLREQGDRKISKSELEDELGRRSFEIRDDVRSADSQWSDIKQRELSDDGTALQTPDGDVYLVENSFRDGWQVRHSRGSFAEGVMDSGFANKEEAMEYIKSYLTDADDFSFSQYTVPGKKENYREILATLARGPTDDTPVFFDDKHFNAENVLAHMRVSDRVVDGKKTLFIEEVQSDWLQAQRGAETARGPDVDVIESVTEADEGLGLPLPQAPMEKTTEWAGLMVRRAFEEAKRGGYERIALPSGDQVADLFDVRKSIEQVELARDGSVRVVDRMGNAHIIPEGEVKSLEATIGAENAELLRNAPADPGGNRVLTSSEMTDGGTGHREFYNKILPGIVRDEARKLGLDVNRLPATRIEDTLAGGERLEKGYRLQETDRGFEVYHTADTETVGFGSTPEEAIASANQYDPDLDLTLPDTNAPTNLVFELTPDVLEAIDPSKLRLWELGGLLAGGTAVGAHRATREREGGGR